MKVKLTKSQLEILFCMISQYGKKGIENYFGSFGINLKIKIDGDILK